MAKKKSNKKHKFKHGSLQSGGPQPASQPAVAIKSDGNNTGATTSTAPVAGQSPAGPRFYGQDVRNTIYFATGLTLLQLVLWYMVNNTQLGPYLYNFIKI